MTQNTLRLNPNLDRKALVETVERDGVVQLPVLFPGEVANALEAILIRNTKWRTILIDSSDRSRGFRPEELAALPQTEAQRLQDEMFPRAHVLPFAGAGRYSVTGWLDHGWIDPDA